MKTISIAEIERQRCENAPIQERMKREHEEEQHVSVNICTFSVERYTKGSFRGLFIVYEHDKGKRSRRIIAEGVNALYAERAMGRRLHQRAFPS